MPSISCLTEPDPLKACAGCLSTSKKDFRRNTSAIVRLEDSSDILIDVGKSFCEAAREHFPKNKVRKLAAVLLTHPQSVTCLYFLDQRGKKKPLDWPWLRKKVNGDAVVVDRVLLLRWLMNILLEDWQCRCYCESLSAQIRVTSFAFLMRSYVVEWPRWPSRWASEPTQWHRSLRLNVCDTRSRSIAWTLGNAIQPKIPIYCDAYTLSEITKAYGYMVNKNAKTGGKWWHIWPIGLSCNLLTWLWHHTWLHRWRCAGFRVAYHRALRPIPIMWHYNHSITRFVWHGWKLESRRLCTEELTTMMLLLTIQILGLCLAEVHHGRFFGSNPRPYICLAYLFDRSLCYMADVSEIPLTTWKLLESSLRPHSSTPEQKEPPILPLLVLDTLRIPNHASHFGLAQAISTARRLNASRTYLLGFAHRVSLVPCSYIFDRPEMFLDWWHHLTFKPRLLGPLLPSDQSRWTSRSGSWTQAESTGRKRDRWRFRPLYSDCPTSHRDRRLIKPGFKTYLGQTSFWWTLAQDRWERFMGWWVSIEMNLELLKPSLMSYHVCPLFPPSVYVAIFPEVLMAK